MQLAGRFKDVASSWPDTLLTKFDGTLWAVGRGHYGQLGNSNNIAFSSPVQVGSESDWAQTYININYASFGLRDNIVPVEAELFVWGRGTYGNLGQVSNVTS